MELKDLMKEECIILLKNITDIQFENFQKTAIYDRILHLEGQEDVDKAFTYEEQALLEKEIRLQFESFFKILKMLCLKLTDKELLICCLSLRFSLLTISKCLGYPNINNVKEHKCRIKKKMIGYTNNDFLFDFIFKKRGNSF